MSMVGRGRRGLELGRGLEQDDASDGGDGGQEEGEAAAAQERPVAAGGGAGGRRAGGGAGEEKGPGEGEGVSVRTREAWRKHSAQCEVSKPDPLYTCKKV